jgi:protein ImuB
LQASGQVAASLELALKLSDDARHDRAFRLPEPTANVDILFRALHTHLESLRTDSSIAGVTLRAEPTRPLVRQHGLFDTALRDPHGFTETLARLVAIVGSDRVGTPQLQDTHRPDAVTLTPPAAILSPAAPPPLHPPCGLPLRRFRPPLPARLELTDGKPSYVWTESFAGTIAEVHGPWLASGHWWQADQSWRRTEYDVSLAEGGLYRLILVDRNWFIEGEYD